MSSASISIPTPCHSSWSTMTPTQRGAFCQACNKEVIDFTSWSDRELVEFLSRKGNICGRVKADQLRTFHIATQRRRGTNWWASIVVVLGLLLSKPATAQNMKGNKVEWVDERVSRDERMKEMREWSAGRTERKPEVQCLPPFVNYEPFFGMLGGVQFTKEPVEQVKPWHTTIYDLLIGL